MTESKGTVLIIEDERMIREYLDNVLGSAGYAVLEAENGNEGLKLLNSSKVDLVITDLIMPEKEGLETIRSAREAQSDLKIIAMSGTPDRETFLSIAQRLGAQATLQKPFLREEVLAVVSSIMS